MLSYDKPVPLNGQAAAPLPSDIAIAGTTAPQAMAAPPTVYPVDGAIPATSQRPNGQPGLSHQIWLVTGPAGSGKSTVAKYLATSLNYSYIEGDEVRP